VEGDEAQHDESHDGSENQQAVAKVEKVGVTLCLGSLCRSLIGGSGGGHVGGDIQIDGGFCDGFIRCCAHVKIFSKSESAPDQFRVI